MIDVMNHSQYEMSSIHFNSHKALASFLAVFLGSGSTAVFNVTDLGDGHYVLNFTGAY
jgi:hypothetical protein